MAISVPIGKEEYTIPRVCACCLVPVGPKDRVSFPDRTQERQFAATPPAGGMEIGFIDTFPLPVCATCQAHSRTSEEKSSLMSVVYFCLASGVVVLALMSAAIQESIGLGVLSGLAFIPYLAHRAKYWAPIRRRRAQAQMKTSCCASGPAVKYDERTLTFHNEKYAEQFLQANASLSRIPASPPSQTA